MITIIIWTFSLTITLLTYIMMFKSAKLETPQYSYLKAFYMSMKDLYSDGFNIGSFGMIFIFPLIPILNLIPFFIMWSIRNEEKSCFNKKEYIDYEFKYKKLVKMLSKQKILNKQQIKDLEISCDLMDELSN